MCNGVFCVTDVTAVCILEGFQNQQSLLMADRVLRELGKAKADAAYKVSCPSNCAKVHFTNDNHHTHVLCIFSMLSTN